MISVYLLGPFTIYTPRGEVVFPTSKVRLLAAYLFWKNGEWVRRDLLRSLLWDDLDEERAAANLRQALYLLRHAFDKAGVPEGILQIRRDGVRVVNSPGCQIDARLFEEKAWTGLKKETEDVGLLAGAASLYRGDFVEDLEADWCLSERRRLADLHLAVLRTLVDRLVALRLYEAAVSYASQWLSLDPLDEAAHRALMRLYAALGQPARVVEQYEQCRQVLQAELGVSPSDSTLRLLQELTSGADEGGTGLRRETMRGRGRRSLRFQSARRSRNFLFPGRLRTFPKKFSTDPLRNARLLLVSGEARSLLRETAEGIKLMEKALALYDRFDNLAARARLMLGEALIWLSIPLSPKIDKTLRQKGLRYIEQALEYYRVNGPPADLGRALQLGAQAYWVMGQNGRAIGLAQEGLTLVGGWGDREAEARLAALLAMSLRESYRLAEAVAAFNRAVECIPYITAPWEILWIIFQRGIFSYIIGDLLEAERFLREALALCQATAFPSLMVKIGECMTRSMMIVVLHYQDRYREMGGFLKPEMGKYNPEPFVYLNRMFTVGKDKRSLLLAIEGWLRARLSSLPGPMIACTIRSVVEEMLAAGLFREGASWAGVGVRLARTREWGGFASLFYCHRAVARLKLGRLGAALVCRRRAAQLADPVDRWVPAWLARIDGLIAQAHGDTEAANRHLEESRRLFVQIGSRYDARQVEDDLAINLDLTNQAE
ncbi:MAG: hypothetical protein M1299_07185 [Firmicutes bacterium]|nr:hypothetical protein [Bacillota bacterium]